MEFCLPHISTIVEQDHLSFTCDFIYSTLDLHIVKQWDKKIINKEQLSTIGEYVIYFVELKSY